MTTTKTKLSHKQAAWHSPEWKRVRATLYGSQKRIVWLDEVPKILKRAEKIDPLLMGPLTAEMAEQHLAYNQTNVASSFGAAVGSRLKKLIAQYGFAPIEWDFIYGEYQASSNTVKVSARLLPRQVPRWGITPLQINYFDYIKVKPGWEKELENVAWTVYRQAQDRGLAARELVAEAA